ncbi:hypothetical protein BJ912DRAFT_1075419 [Pholiota molesta]|nr:hypothetical protein BJ912DRAFT_1075419 [Pholiota molesta]
MSYVLEEGSRVGPSNELEILRSGLSKAIWNALVGDFFQKLWRAARMADSVARDESKGVLTLVGARGPRGMAQGGLLVILDFINLGQALSRRAVWRRVIGSHTEQTTPKFQPRNREMDLAQMLKATPSSSAHLALAHSDLDKQAQRRMLSPALQRLPWGTNIMEILQQLDHNGKHGEIISNVLRYEQKYLLNGGASKESMDMQSLLGIKFEVHSDGSGYHFFSITPPNWNDLQAWKVCNLACNYKLAEVLSIVNDSVVFTSTLQPAAVGTFNLTNDARGILHKLSYWPNVLKDFRANVVSPPSLNDEFTSSLPASLQLLQALSNANSTKKGAKIRHNFLIAATHIAFIKEYQFDKHQCVAQDSDYNVPDFPDMTSKDFLADLRSKLTGTAPDYIVKLSSSEPSRNALRFVLHIALLVSPLCLCLPIAIHKKAFGRKSLMELSSILGSNKPEILRRVEKLLWAAIFGIVEQPQDVGTILKKLADTFPWNDISALSDQIDQLTGWFNLGARTMSIPASPSTSVTEAMQGAIPPPAFNGSEEPTGGGDVNYGASSQVPVTEAGASATVMMLQERAGVSSDVGLAPGAQPSNTSGGSVVEDKEDQVDWGDEWEDDDWGQGPSRWKARVPEAVMPVVCIWHSRGLQGRLKETWGEGWMEIQGERVVILLRRNVTLSRAM